MNKENIGNFAGRVLNKQFSESNIDTSKYNSIDHLKISSVGKPYFPKQFPDKYTKKKIYRPEIKYQKPVIEPKVYPMRELKPRVATVIGKNRNRHEYAALLFDRPKSGSLRSHHMHLKSPISRKPKQIFFDNNSDIK